MESRNPEVTERINGLVVESFIEEDPKTIAERLAECPDFPIGTITATAIGATFDKKMKHLERCFQKYGHRFARKKRQMKKNRRKYGMGWKMCRIGKLIQKNMDKEGGPEWVFLGRQGGPLLDLDSHCPEFIPIRHMMRIK